MINPPDLQDMMTTPSTDETSELFGTTTPVPNPSSTPDVRVETDREGADLPTPQPPLVAGPDIQHVPFDRLQPHPLNEVLYGYEGIDEELLASIKALGVLTPLHVTTNGVILSGHRRYQAALAADVVMRVPVFVVELREGTCAEEELILEANRARRKNNEQLVREFIAYKAIEAEKARIRSGHRADLVPKSAPGSTLTTPQGKLVTQTAGKARDLAADKVGLAGSTAANGEKVVMAIDKLWKEGKWKEAVQLRRTLKDQSINAAYHEALEHGWIAAPAKKRTPQSTAATRETVTVEDIDDHGDAPVSQNVQPDAADVRATSENTGSDTPAEVAGSVAEDGEKSRDVADLFRDKPLPDQKDAPDEPTSTPVSVPSDIEAAAVSPAPEVLAPHIAAVTPVPGPVATPDEGADETAEDLIPADMTAKAKAKVNPQNFEGRRELVECSRRSVPLVAQALNLLAREFPELEGVDLYKALGNASNQIYHAMRWGR